MKLFEKWREEHCNETKACLALKILGFCYTNIVTSHDKRLAIRMPDYGGASTDTIQGLKHEFARQIQGLPLVPMVSGDVKVIQSHGERPCFATARQRFLTPSIDRRLVHPDALQAVPELFDDPTFLKSIHVDTFSPTMLKEHLETQFPAQWKGCSVVSWTGEAGVPGPSSEGGVPSPLWIFNFWKEVSYAGSAAADLFRGWPLIPISTNELLSCSLSAAVLYVSEMQLERDKYDSLVQQNAEATLLPSEEATEDAGRQRLLPSQDPSSSSSSSLSSLENSSSSVQDVGHASLPVLPRQEIYGILKTLGVPLVRACVGGGAGGSVEPISASQLPIRIIESLTILTSMTKDTVALVPRPSSSSSSHKCSYQVVQDSWLKWERLSTEDRGKMLSFLDSQMSVVVGGDYSLAEKKTVAQLPLFRTLGGRFVSIYGRDYYILEVGVDPHELLLPADAQCLVLERTDETPVDLIKKLGVKELTVEAALQRFTLPTFLSISTENQDSLRSFIVEKWPSLRKSSSLVDALKKMPVAVNGRGDAVCASELLDPQSSLLTDIFADEPHKFPSQAYQSSEASLLFLNDMGLQRHIGPALFVECAAKLQSTGEAEQLRRVSVNGQGRPARENMAQSLLPCSACTSTAAARLLDYFMEHFQSLYSSKLCSSLAPLFFVPVPEVKIDAETMIRGGTAVVHLEGDDSALREARESSATSAKTNMCLARFCDVVIWNDRHLAWTVKSILQDRFVPPQVSWKHLGIESPPALSMVTRHVTHLSNFVMAEVEMHEHGISATLGRMNKTDFVRIFRHLEKESCESHHGDGNMFCGIEHLPCVPIGEALVRPQQIYRRLENSLPPLMYRVPEGMEELRCVCFKSLPSPRDYVESVRQLKRTVGNKPLNPQEIAVVLRMAHLLTETIATAATTSSSTTTGTTKPPVVNHVDHVEKEFLVPDKMGCLVPVGLCVLDDDPSLTSRIFDSQQEHPHTTTPVERGMSVSLRVAHPKLPRAVAEKLGIPRVSTIMEERLTTDFEDFEPMSMTRTFSNVHGDGPHAEGDCSREIIREEQRLNALLQSVDFSKAIISISNRDSAEDSISSSVHRAHHAPTLLDYDHRVYELHQLLQAWHVCFVDKLVTQFVPNEKLLGDDVYIQSIQSSASWFLRHAGKQILVSLASTEGRHKSDDTSCGDVFDKSSRGGSSRLYVLHSLAVAIGMLVQGIVPLKQPLVLTAALSCEKSAGISDMLHRLKVTLSEESIHEMVRGTAGQLVTPADKACLKISPLHYFTRGEIVAFKDKTHEGAGSRTASSLRYGVVKNVTSNSIVKNEPGGDHSPRSESPSLCNDSSSVIEVQVSSDTTKLFPRTSVYVFTQTRTSGDTNELHVGGHSSHGNAASSSSISESASAAASASSEKQRVYGMVETKISDQNRTTSQENADGADFDGSEPSSTTTKEDEVFEAVNELLSSLHLKVSPDVISLAKENARLRQEHERSEQMQSAMRKQLSRYAEFVDRLEAGMICPITQEVIQYPGVASDGHTYEGDFPSMVSICKMLLLVYMPKFIRRTKTQKKCRSLLFSPPPFSLSLSRHTNPIQSPLL